MLSRMLRLSHSLSNATSACNILRRWRDRQQHPHHWPILESESSYRDIAAFAWLLHGVLDTLISTSTLPSPLTQSLSASGDVSTLTYVVLVVGDDVDAAYQEMASLGSERARSLCMDTEKSHLRDLYRILPRRQTPGLLHDDEDITITSPMTAWVKVKPWGWVRGNGETRHTTGSFS